MALGAPRIPHSRTRSYTRTRKLPCDAVARGAWRLLVKKFLGIFALLGGLAAAVMFWRRRQEDDEFLDEELE